MHPSAEWKHYLAAVQDPLPTPEKLAPELCRIVANVRELLRKVLG